MINEQNTNLIIHTLGFFRYESIPPENHCGGICCLWNLVYIDVTIIAKESQAIHCYIVDNTNSKQCMSTAIYASAQNQDKL